MVMREITTERSMNPKYPEHLLIASRQTETEKAKLWFLPKQCFTELMLELSKKTGEIAPLAPYPMPLFGTMWKCNQTNYRKVVKILDKMEEQYGVNLMEEA